MLACSNGQYVILWAHWDAQSFSLVQSCACSSSRVLCCPLLFTDAHRNGALAQWATFLWLLLQILRQESSGTRWWRWWREPGTSKRGVVVLGLFWSSTKKAKRHGEERGEERRLWHARSVSLSRARAWERLSLSSAPDDGSASCVISSW